MPAMRSFDYFSLVDLNKLLNIQPNNWLYHVTDTFDQCRKSHNAPVPYPIVQHLNVRISVAMWCIVGYGTGALWHLWHRSIVMTYPYSTQCRICRVFFDNQPLLEAHMAEKHPEGSLVNFCTLCSLQFSSKHLYQNHMFEIHEKNVSARPVLSCPACPFQTLGRMMLVRHMATHKELHAPCPICGKTFSTQGKKVQEAFFFRNWFHIIKTSLTK